MVDMAGYRNHGVALEKKASDDLAKHEAKAQREEDNRIGSIENERLGPTLEEHLHGVIAAIKAHQGAIAAVPLNTLPNPFLSTTSPSAPAAQAQRAPAVSHRRLYMPHYLAWKLAVLVAGVLR